MTEIPCGAVYHRARGRVHLCHYSESIVYVHERLIEILTVIASALSVSEGLAVGVIVACVVIRIDVREGVKLVCGLVGNVSAYFSFFISRAIRTSPSFDRLRNYGRFLVGRPVAVRVSVIAGRRAQLIYAAVSERIDVPTANADRRTRARA